MNDPYVYENTDVLINKLNIRDSETLELAESEYVIVAIERLRNDGFSIASIYDALKIHYTLFNPIYEWAGELRTIDIYKREPLLDGKSIDYVFASYLPKALRELQSEFALVDWGKLASEEKIERVCYFVSEFWHTHPFREGNTRTSALLLYFLIKKSGLHIDLDFLSKNGKYFWNALVLSCLYSASKKEFLTGIVVDAVSKKNPKSGKYTTIDGVEVRKYAYTKHTLEKLETIRKPSDWMDKSDSSGR